MKNIKINFLLGLLCLLFLSPISSQNIGVSGSFIPSTIENCQTSELTIFFSNEDFVTTVSSGEAMISVVFPITGEYTTPTDPPVGTSFSWTLIDNTWKGMLNTDVGPLSSVEIIFIVTAVELTSSTSSDLEVNLTTGIDLNTVNNMASPSLEIIEFTGPIVNNCPTVDQGTFSCLEDIPAPALTIAEFNTLFGNNVLNQNFCGDITFSFFSDTTNLNTGCAMDPVILTRSYVFQHDTDSDTCSVQYTIIDDVSPEVSCMDITLALDENGMIVINPEDLSAGVINTCDGSIDEMVTFTVSQSTFDCSDLDPNAINCGNTFTVKLYAKDVCGNIDSCDANITIIDNTPPILICPVNLTVSLDPGECSTQHFFDIPTASDNCDAFTLFNTQTMVTQVGGTDLTSGDTFYPGIYTWSYEAVDGCGNVSQCEFILEVAEYNNEYLLSLACNDLLNISLNQDCSVEIGADMILEGGPYRCYEDYIIEIEGIIGTIITAPGLYTVTITDPETGNNCWSNVNIEDKLPPVINCKLPFCETESLTGSWSPQSESFLPDATCWVFDSTSPLNNVSYDIIEIVIQVAGDYTFTMTDNSNYNGIAALYSDSFDPMNSCENLLAGDDDLNGIVDSEPQFSISLLSGTYYLLSSNWSSNITENYTWTYTGPSAILAECQYKCFDFSAILKDDLPIPLPEVTDCSNYSMSHSDSYSGNDCFGKFITRTYIATDINGRSSNCSLTFELQPISIQDDIILPIQLVELNCNESTDPQDIVLHFDNTNTKDNPSTEIIENNEGFVYAFPTYIQNGHAQKIDNNVCSIYAVYDDLELQVCEEGCQGNRKVIRTWTILDWCNSEVLNFKQTIKAIDKEAPTLDINDISVSTDYLDCQASFDIPQPSNFHDNCDSAPKYSISGPAGITILGTFETKFTVINAPKGIHTFYYNAYDCCGNDESYPFSVFVQDITPPIVVAKQDIVISLTNGVTDEDGFAKMFTESVDNGSHDGCSSNLKLEIRRDSDFCNVSGNLTYNSDGHPQDGSPIQQASNYDSDNGAFVKFCCDDITNAVIDINGDGINDPGYVKVWLRVWDDGDMDGQFGTNGDNYNEAWVHVKVEDKLDPVILCPADVSITCDMDYEDLSVTGKADALGSCGSVEVEYEDIIINLNSCDQGIIRRRWKAVGNNNIFCDQNITIENINDSTPIVNFSQVGNFSAIGCPDMISIGEPTWQAGSCDMMAYTVKTDTFKFEDGACYKLLREYTVINWCDYQPSNPQWVETSDFTDGLVKHLQVIKVTDETKPELSTCENQIFEINDHFDEDNDGNICEAKVTLSNTAIDVGSQNCPTGWLKWQVIIDLWGDGIDDLEYNSYLPPFDINFNDSNGNGIPDVYIAPTQSGEQININLPDITGSMSNHKVTWKVSDGCNNSTSCSYDFMVVDKKAPTPYCVDISSAVMESSGTVELWAVDFNIGSFDNCTSNEELRYTFTSTLPSNDINYDPTKKSSKKIFDCDDVLNSPVKVLMYVWDEKDNYDFCYVNLSLIDNSGACGDGMKINGNIATESGQIATHIEVKLNSLLPEYPRNGYTNVYGAYSFSNIPLNSDYEISAEYDEDYLNGVSTLDLVKIQRHLLGIETLNSPYKLIAADINGDNLIKASDLTQLRKLILGVSTNLTENESWRFVDASQDLNMNINLEDVSYKKSINNLQSNLEGINLIAVKIGDVSDNAGFNLKGNINSEIRSSHALTFKVKDSKVKENDLIEIEFFSSTFTNIIGYQFTINLNGLEFTGIESGNSGITYNNVAKLNENTVTVSYNSTSPITTKEVDGLFTAYFKANKNGRIHEMLSFNSTVTPSEAYSLKDNGEIEILSVNLEVDNENEGFSKNILYQNEPNPFEETTVIGYDLILDGPVKFSIYDPTGKILKIIDTIGKKGHNEIIVNANEIPTKGLIIYKIESNQFIESKKMIIID